MKQFCQYLSIFSFFIIFHGDVHASQDAFGCALNAERQNFGGLPGFTSSSQPLIGYSCELRPKRSTYLGNWFPSLPQLAISQTSRLLTTGINEPEADDYSESWYFDLAIKRIGDSQLVLLGGLKKGRQTLSANENTLFFSDDASNIQDAITIQQGQQAYVSYTENKVGLSFVFPYREHHPLTRITLQQRTISQPLQANINNFSHSSLHNTQSRLTELGIKSNSYNKGFNINWGLALAAGDIRFNSDIIPKNNVEYNKIISVSGILELYYQYRFSRHWFAFSRWQGDVNYWRQGKTDNPEYQLPEANNIGQQVHLGLGFSF